MYNSLVHIAGESCIFPYVQLLHFNIFHPWGQQSECVKLLTHAYPHKSFLKIKAFIGIHKADSPFYLWTDVCSGD